MNWYTKAPTPKFSVTIAGFLFASTAYLYLSSFFFPPYQSFTVNSVEKHDSCCCNVIGGAWLEIKIIWEVSKKREGKDRGVQSVWLWRLLVWLTKWPASKNVTSAGCFWIDVIGFITAPSNTLEWYLCETITHGFPRIVYTHTSTFKHPQMSGLKHMCTPAL